MITRIFVFIFILSRIKLFQMLRDFKKNLNMNLNQEDKTRFQVTEKKYIYISWKTLALGD